MSTDLAPFVYEGQTVRVVTGEHGDPAFVASDVSSILGYRNAHDLTRNLEDDDKGYAVVSTPGGDQRMLAITEAGLYVGVLGAKVARARDFKRWVTREVLPSIRRTGAYGTPTLALDNADHVALIVQAGYAALTRALDAEAKVADLAPRAAVADTLMTADGDCSLREAAAALSRDHGITTGQNRLLAHLRELGWVDRNGKPYRAHLGGGGTARLAVRVTTYDHPHTHEATISTQLRVTPKGLTWLHEHWPRTADLSLVAGGAS